MKKRSMFSGVIVAATVTTWPSFARAQQADASAAVEAPKATPAPGASSDAAAQAEPKVSVALERVAGFSLATVSASDTDASVTATVLNVGAVTVNPYGAPRLGVDFALGSGLWLGGALGFVTLSGTADDAGRSEKIGSATLYTFTPRLGYRIAVSPSVDIVPRAGMTLAGGSATAGDGPDKLSVFAAALSLEGLVALRMTSSFNLLGGLAFDRTLTGTATSTGGGGAAASSDIDGALTNLQLWLGLGGYL